VLVKRRSLIRIYTYLIFPDRANGLPGDKPIPKPNAECQRRRKNAKLGMEKTAKKLN